MPRRIGSWRDRLGALSPPPKKAAPNRKLRYLLACCVAYYYDTKRIRDWQGMVCQCGAPEEDHAMSNLEELLQKARDTKMSEAERETQRLSFAYGNLRIKDETVTRDSLRRASRSLNSAQNNEQPTS